MLKEKYMVQLKKDEMANFMDVVKKYAKVRKSLTFVGNVKVNRFYKAKKKELTPKLVGDIMKLLRIPIHEVIDFVEDDYADKFVSIMRSHN